MSTLVFIFCVFLSYLSHSNSSRILAIFPHYGVSHFMMFEPLMVELTNRGHEVVVISRYPQRKPVKNYIDIDVNNDVPMPNNEVPFHAFDKIPVPLLVDLHALYKFLLDMEGILITANFQHFLKSNETFDLMITEAFNTRLFFALAHKMQIPFITLSSCTLPQHVSYDIANPINPSYIPALVSYYNSKMNFWQRLHNLYITVVHAIAVEYVLNTKSEEMKRKYFGEDLPPLREIAKNTSLTLVNSYFALNQPRPFVPSVVEVGGLFLTPSAKPLPQNIEKFINESTHGVVYFCMGSLLRGETFPAEKRDAFLYAFSKIPQRVLWKWEGEVLPGKSENIMTSKWMPQRDILAHPNVKLFISHGGLLGTSEAVYEGVPVIGIPIFGDQRTNIKALEANGAGELLDYNDISGEVVLEKIQRLINDPKYKESARQLSIRYKDRPMSPLDTAVYWTEYVIRHKGAPHLKTAAVDMPWYQYLLLDVIAFLIFILVSVILIIYYGVKISLRYLCALIFGNSSSLKPTKKVKDN